MININAMSTNCKNKVIKQILTLYRYNVHRHYVTIVLNRCSQWPYKYNTKSTPWKKNWTYIRPITKEKKYYFIIDTIQFDSVSLIQSSCWIDV